MKIPSVICAVGCVMCAVVTYYLISVGAQMAAFFMSYTLVFAALWVGVQMDKKPLKPTYSNPDRHAYWNRQIRTMHTGEYVYVIRDVEITGYYKIGRTNKPSRRINTFEVKLPFRTEIVNILSYPSCVFLESRLHEMFASKRVNGEWFNLDAYDLAVIGKYARQQTDGGEEAVE